MALRRARNTQEKGEAGFAEASQREPHAAIHNHLQEIYQGDVTVEWVDTEEETFFAVSMPRLAGLLTFGQGEGGV